MALIIQKSLTTALIATSNYSICIAVAGASAQCHNTCMFTLLTPQHPTTPSCSMHVALAQFSPFFRVTKPHGGFKSFYMAFERLTVGTHRCVRCHAPAGLWQVPHSAATKRPVINIWTTCTHPHLLKSFEILMGCSAHPL